VSATVNLRDMEALQCTSRSMPAVVYRMV
jgi:hypothetical protein